MYSRGFFCIFSFLKHLILHITLSLFVFSCSEIGNNQKSIVYPIKTDYLSPYNSDSSYYASITTNQLDDSTIVFEITTAKANGCIGNLTDTIYKKGITAFYSTEDCDSLQFTFIKDSLFLNEIILCEFHGMQCPFHGVYVK